MTNCLITAAIPRTIDLFLGPHIRRLRETGMTVHVASSGKPLVADEQGLAFHRVGFSRSPLDLKGHVRAWREYRRLVDELTASGEPLLLHLHTPIAAALARLALRRSHPVKVLYMAHGFHFLPGERNVYHWVERVLAGRTDLYVLINDDDVVSARALSGGESRRWTKIPGVGLQRVIGDEARPARRPEAGADPRARRAPRRVLVVGLLEARKHPTLAVRAAALLDDDVHVHFCGDGPLEPELRRLARSLGCERRVHFEGWTDDILPHFREADCLLFLSEREGLPMTVAEALACRLAVVAFDIRGVRDLLQGLNGWKIPDSRSPRAVADAVRAALDTEIDAAAYRERAERFSLAASLDAHEGAVRHLLQSDVRRSGARDGELGGTRARTEAT